MRDWQPFCRIEAHREDRELFALDKRTENCPQLAAMSFQMRGDWRGKAAN